MRRAHRRGHLLLWAVLGPATVAAALWALARAPERPFYGDIPAPLAQDQTEGAR